jgi:hypothetical protein
MEPDLIRALSISGSILIGVVLLIIIVTFVTVHRGEVEMEKDAKRHGGTAHH